MQIFQVGPAEPAPEPVEMEGHIFPPGWFKCTQQIGPDRTTFQATEPLLLPDFAEQRIRRIGGRLTRLCIAELLVNLFEAAVLDQGNVVFTDFGVTGNIAIA